MIPAIGRVLAAVPQPGQRQLHTGDSSVLVGDASCRTWSGIQATKWWVLNSRGFYEST